MPRRSRTTELLEHLASKPGHDEVKSDFRDLLVREFSVALSDLDFERRVPEVKGRIDALIGRTVFEAKSDLAKEWADVERRMPDYLADREREERERFIGIASDGRHWAVFELSDGKLVRIKDHTLDPDKPDVFLAWLDGVVALKSSLPPNALTIRAELGGDSVAYRRASVSLAELWSRLKDRPAVALKRQLWGQLLKLVYGREIEGDALWFQHTFLVIVAKAIALAVLDLKEDDPKRLLSGHAFEAVGIHGAVESDFFDWIVADPDGEALVRRLMAHIRRFRLGEVESDVLKILYESLIDRDERHGLGEYYTPDWLAAKVTRHAVTAPLEQRVLDPACGSGTFLFHAIRLFLAEAAEADMRPADIAREATEHVAGMDIHPVAVIIARVTCLLALAPALATRAGALTVRVYLGDAMQLSVAQVMTETRLSIAVPPGPAGEAATSLEFPALLCQESEVFDEIVEILRSGSEADNTRQQVEIRIERAIQAYYARLAARYPTPVIRSFGEPERNAVTDLGATFLIYDRLRREGRDSVWSYVARNLSRPLAYSSGGGWAQVVVGNPPWVAFRHMSGDLQVRFKELAKAERVLVGRVPSQNDLSALFTVRATALYLRAAGRIAFVLPLATLSRNQFERLRSGSFTSARIAWDEVWTMDETVTPLFPVPSCVVFGRRRAASKPMPEMVRAYSGTLRLRDAPEAMADASLNVYEGIPRPSVAVLKGGSAYRRSFRNGATLFPRVLCFVERRAAGRLGANPAAPLVVSRRSPKEKEPWKSIPAVEGSVEVEFLHNILLGESIIPYRLLRKFEGIVPVTAQGEMLDANAAANRGLTGLQAWMSRAEEAWIKNRRSNMDLIQLFNYINQLSSQFPIEKLRLVYSKAGLQPAATIIRNSSAIIENTLYWSAPSNEQEAFFLVALLNSETARARTERFQARGQFGARHFDKVIFSLPIPRFDETKELHNELATAAAEAEEVAAAVDLPDGVRFQRARKLVRDALTDAGIAPRIDALVARLLDE